MRSSVKAACVGAISLFMAEGFVRAQNCIPAESPDDLIRKITAAENEREHNLAGYTVTETYRVFNIGNDLSIGEGVAKTTYTHGEGKTFKKLQPSGSAAAKYAIGRMLDEQELMSKPDARRKIIPTSENYVMHLLGPEDPQPPPSICGIKLPAHTCVLGINPKVPGPGVIGVGGYLWVDATNHLVVRIQGKLSEPPKPWFVGLYVGHASVERNYADFPDMNGYAMATSACSITEESHFHKQHKVKITYSDYHLLQLTGDQSSRTQAPGP